MVIYGDLWWFNGEKYGDLMVINMVIQWWFNGDSMVIYGDLMVKNMVI